MSDFFSNFQDKNVVHISDSDLDGVASTILALYYIEPLCNKYIPINTGERDMSEIPDIINDITVDTVLFTDIAPTIELCKELIKNGKKIIIVDHHITSKELLTNLDLNKHKYYYTEDNCATTLFYDLIMEGCRRNRTINRFVHLVNTYDTWRDNHEDWENAKELHYLKNKCTSWYMGNSAPEYDKNLVFIKNISYKFENDRKFCFKYNDLRMIKAEKENEQKAYNIAKKKLRKSIDSKGNSYIYVECPSKVSIIGNRLLKEHNDVKYALCRSTYRDAKATFSFSLRSKGDFDIRHIAESYGGGGHSSSSGFKAKDENEYNSLISGIKHPI